MKTEERVVTKIRKPHHGIITITIAGQRREYIAAELRGLKRKTKIQVPRDDETPAVITDLDGKEICRAYPMRTQGRRREQ